MTVQSMRAEGVATRTGLISTMSRQTVNLKRREPDDLAWDLLNVSLSPGKKSRFSVQGAGFDDTFRGSADVVVPQAADSQVIMPTVSVPSMASIVPPVPSMSEERALVLYRPVNLPLFPGGPPAGSDELPLRVNVPMMVSFPNGIDNGCAPSYFSETSSQLACQSALSNCRGAVSGHGLFQALDLSGSGGPLNFSGSRRLNRVSSCSSLPNLPFYLGDQPMMEDVDRSSQLAVIPWAPMTPIVMASESKPIIEEVDCDEMMESEDMDHIDEDAGLSDNETSVVCQFSSPMPTFGSSIWPQADLLQPSVAMWSH